MDKSGESLRDAGGASKERGTWVEQQLGDGWTEVEPGIYRFTGGDGATEDPSRPAPPTAPAPPSEDLLEALQPTSAEPEAAQPTGRRFGRRRRAS